MDKQTSDRLDQRALSYATQITAIDRDSLPGGENQYKARVQVLIREALKNAWFQPLVIVGSPEKEGELRWYFAANWDAAMKMYVTIDPIMPGSPNAKAGED